MFVNRLNLLLRDIEYPRRKDDQEADTTSAENPGKRILTCVQAPPVASGKTSTSAAIYGEHLYVAQSPVTDGTIVLHVTDFSALLQLDNNDAPVWTKHVITLDQQVWSHIAASEASVSLFTTKQRNPNYTRA